MAIARCGEGHLDRNRTKKNYTAVRLPVGFPDSGVICGNPSCSTVAQIFLTEAEDIDYQKGQRIFSFDSRAAKVKVQ